MRNDVALEGIDPKCVKRFRLIGLPIGATLAILLSIGVFYAPTPAMQGFFAITLLMGAIFSATEGFETDMWQFPKATPVRGGILSGFLITTLIFVFFSVIRYVNGP